MSNPIVIDISHHNPTPDWENIQAGGTRGVILKATEGTSYVDDTYAHRYPHARMSGLFVASYHFLRHDGVEEQMGNFVSAMASVGVQDGDRVVIDYEHVDCTLDDLVRAVDWLFNNTTYEIAVYGASKLTDDARAATGYAAELLRKTSLWIARYSTDMPDFARNIWSTWSLWQNTDKAKVQGVSQPVDGNRWNGDPERLIDWFYRPTDPVPVPETPEVVIDITIPPGVALTIRVNGDVQETIVG